MRRWRILVGLAILAVFGGLLYLAVFAYQSGFTKKWRRLIRDEFAKHHLQVDIGKLTIDPFQGLVANNVTLLEDTEARQVVATISSIRLDLDLPKLLREERSLERLELRSADFSLPFRDSKEEGRLVLTDLNATILFSPGRMEIVEAEARFYGVTLKLTGSLLQPPEESGRKPFSLAQERVKDVQRVVEAMAVHLRRLAIQPSARPEALLHLTGDLAKPETVVLAVHLKGRDFAYGNYPLRELTLWGDLNSERFELENLTLRDAAGRLDLSMQIPLRGGDATIAGESTLRLQDLLAAIFSEEEPEFPAALERNPFVEMRGSFQLGKAFEWTNLPVDVVGRFASEAFRFNGVRFENCAGNFHVQGERMFVRDFVLSHRSGATRGKLLSTPEEGIRYEASVDMDPTLLKAFPLPEEALRFLDRWRFDDHSKVSLDLRGERPVRESATWDHEGKLNVSGCEFETASLDYLVTDIHLNPHVYHFKNLRTGFDADGERGYPGGALEVQSISFSAADRVTLLTNLRGRFHPAQVVRCFAPGIADHLDRFQFLEAPEVRVDGTLSPKKPEQTNIPVRLVSDELMKVRWKEAQLPVDKPVIDLRFYNDSLLINSATGDLFGGKLTGSMNVTDLAGERSYSAKVKLDGVGVQGLAERYFPKYPTEGRLTGEFHWSGKGAKLVEVSGQGSGRLEDGQTAALPLLGPLARLLERALQTDALSDGRVKSLAGSFKLDKGVVSTSEMTAVLDAYEVEAAGEADLIRDRVDLEVSVTKPSVSGVLLNVLYSVLGTYQCTGKLSDPDWKLAAPLSVDSLREAFEDPAALQDPVRALRKLLPKQPEQPAEKNEEGR